MRIVATFEYLEQAWDEAAKLIQTHPGKLYDVVCGNNGFDVREFLEDQPPTPTKEINRGQPTSHTPTVHKRRTRKSRTSKKR